VLSLKSRGLLTAHERRISDNRTLFYFDSDSIPFIREKWAELRRSQSTNRFLLSFTVPVALREQVYERLKSEPKVVAVSAYLGDLDFLVDGEWTGVEGADEFRSHIIAAFPGVTSWSGLELAQMDVDPTWSPYAPDAMSAAVFLKLRSAESSDEELRQAIAQCDEWVTDQGNGVVEHECFDLKLSRAGWQVLIRAKAAGLEALQVWLSRFLSLYQGKESATFLTMPRYQWMQYQAMNAPTNDITSGATDAIVMCHSSNRDVAQMWSVITAAGIDETQRIAATVGEFDLVFEFAKLSIAKLDNAVLNVLPRLSVSDSATVLVIPVCPGYSTVNHPGSDKVSSHPEYDPIAYFSVFAPGTNPGYLKKMLEGVGYNEQSAWRVDAMPVFGKVDVIARLMLARNGDGTSGSATIEIIDQVQDLLRSIPGVGRIIPLCVVNSKERSSAPVSR
jgi:hypothetical protein